MKINDLLNNKYLFKISIVISILSFIFFYSRYLNHGLPFFVNNDEIGFLKSTLFFFNFFSSNYKYLADPFYSPLFNFLGSAFIALVDALIKNNYSDIANHIYFNPSLLMKYGRLTSLLVSGLSLFVIYLILNKLRISKIITLNLMISISLSLFFLDISLTNGKNSFFLLFFLLQYYFFLKYFQKIEKFNIKSYFVFGFLAAFSWGINYFCAVVSITSILLLHYKRYKFTNLYYFIYFLILFFLVGFIPNYLFNETSTIWHWIDISDPSNNTIANRLYKFQDSFIRASKIIYFTERYYFLLFIIIFIFYIKSKRLQNRFLFFFTTILLLEPIFLLLIAERAIPQLKYFSPSIVLAYILFGLGFNEILKIYKRKILISLFLIINFIIIILKFSQLSSAMNIIKSEHNFYNVYNKEVQNSDRTIYFLRNILIRKNKNNLNLYKDLHLNDLIEEKWYGKDNLQSLDTKLKKVDNKYLMIPSHLKKITVLENIFDFKDVEKLFKFLKEEKGYDFIVIPDIPFKQRTTMPDFAKRYSIIEYVENNFKISNYYEGNDLDTARNVVEKIYLGKMLELKNEERIGYPYKVYRIN